MAFKSLQSLGDVFDLTFFGKKVELNLQIKDSVCQSNSCQIYCVIFTSLAAVFKAGKKQTIFETLYVAQSQNSNDKPIIY